MFNFLGETAYWSLLTCINGGLCGMVAMCAGCNVLNQGAAFGIGGMAGITIWWVSMVLRRMGVDDPLDAFAVHYGGGIVGVLATPVFMNGGIVDSKICKDQLEEYVLAYFPTNSTGTGCFADPMADGCFSCDRFEYKVFAWNLVGLLAITLWAGGLSFAMFMGLKFFNLLR